MESRETDLPNVVEQRGRLNVVKLYFVNPKVFTNSNGPLGQARCVKSCPHVL